VLLPQEEKPSMAMIILGVDMDCNSYKCKRMY
jgi:hypothetical protein